MNENDKTKLKNLKADLVKDELRTHKFVRKPFYVDAVRVSEANIEKVAKWCGGEIQVEDDQRFVKVEVHRPLTERQTQAFFGDWVLSSGNGFKVYVPKAFDKSFEKVKTLTKEQADAAGIKVPHEKRAPKKTVTQKGSGRRATVPADEVKKAPVPTPPKKIYTEQPVGEAPKKDSIDKFLDEVAGDTE